MSTLELRVMRSVLLFLCVPLLVLLLPVRTALPGEPLPACWKGKLKGAAAYAKQVGRCAGQDLDEAEFDECVVPVAKILKGWERAQDKTEKKGADCREEGPSLLQMAFLVRELFDPIGDRFEEGLPEDPPAAALAKPRIVLAKASGIYIAGLLTAESKHAAKPNDDALAAGQAKAREKFGKAWGKAVARALKDGLDFQSITPGVEPNIEEPVRELAAELKRGTPPPRDGDGGGGGSCGSVRASALVDGRQIKANGSRRVGYLPGIGCFGDDCVSIGIALGNKVGIALIFDNFRPTDPPTDFTQTCDAVLGYEKDRDLDEFGDEDVWIDSCADVVVTATNDGAISGTFSGVLTLELGAKKGSGPDTIVITDGEFRCVRETPTTSF